MCSQCLEEPCLAFFEGGGLEGGLSDELSDELNRGGETSLRWRRLYV